MKVNDRVNRKEHAEITGATVLEIDGENALISYDEGGEGWWPLDCLEPEGED
jgi:hypothetical protein